MKQTFTFQNARGPVHAVVSENWAVYHFWSVKAARWQVGSIELYDATPRNISVADLALLGAPKNATLSPWDAVPLETYSNSFFTKLAVETLAVTRTAQGITLPQVLFGTPSGELRGFLFRMFVTPSRDTVIVKTIV